MRPIHQAYVAAFILTFLLISCGGSKKLTVTASNKNKEIQNKFSALLDVPREAITNYTLYQFIQNWMETPYKYGGKDQNGIDCSGFTSRLEKEVFGKEITGPSWSIAENAQPVKESDLQEGDLVFFRIESKKISHVGVYLQNKKFIHASTTKGVIISSLEENYYKKYLHSFGRPK